MSKRVTVKRRAHTLSGVDDLRAAPYNPCSITPEALSAGVPTCFDEATVPILARIGVDVQDYAVDGKEAVAGFLRRNRRALIVEQRKRWLRDYREDCARSLRAVACNSGIPISGTEGRDDEEV